MNNSAVIFRAAVGLPLGFFLPGYLLARLLNAPYRLLWAFPLSLLILFHSIFAVGAVGLPVTGSLVAAVLFSIVLVLLALGQFNNPPTPQSPPNGVMLEPWIAWSLIGALYALCAVVLWRTTLWPLSGADTPFRWDFLATRMLDQRGFQYYPAITGSDFRIYFLADGIPPMVSFSYWWLYIVTGGHHAPLTGILVAAQLASTLGFTWAAGRAIHSHAAGLLSAGILGASILLVWATAVGQETGLTALSMAAMLCAVTSDDQRSDWRATILVGLAGALGALAREYGLLIPALGCLAILWRGKGCKNAALAAATAFVTAAPWYLRNAIRTGNPLFSNRLGSLYVNPLHARMMDNYRAHLGVSTWKLDDWLAAAANLLVSAPLQCTIGLAAAAILFRKWGFLSVIAAVMGAVWLYSIGFTSGVQTNPWFAARVLTPALVALSLLAGTLIARWSQRKVTRQACGLLVLAVLGWTLAAATIFPHEITSSTFKHWGANFTSRTPPSSHWWDPVPQVLPQGSRVLSYDAYIHAGLANSGIEIVPVISPEVGFLTDPSLTPRAVRLKLLDCGIRYVIYEPDMNGEFLRENIPFYKEDMAHWRPLSLGSPDLGRLYELTPDN